MAESEPAIRAAATLVAGGVRPTQRGALDADAAVQTTMRAAIESFLDRTDTQTDERGVMSLCQRFGVSRASLYRMFQPVGGLVHHVRDRQLRRALDVLVSPAHRHRKIVEIALQHGFTTESGFIRAFRRRFGVTPGDVRSEPPSAHADPRTGVPRSTAWLLALSSRR